MRPVYNVPALERLRKAYKTPLIIVFFATLLLIGSIGLMASTGSNKFTDDDEYYEEDFDEAEGLKYLPLALIVFVPVIITCATKSEKAKKEFIAQYKSTLVRSVFSNYFSNAYFTENKGFSETEVKGFCLSKTANAYWSGNYASGEYMGITFEQADVIIEHDDLDGAVLDHDATNGVTPYFNGRMTIFNFPENEVNGVQSYSKKYKYAPTEYKGQNLQYVSMDSSGLNQAFVTTAVAPQDVDLVLTTPMIEKLLELSKTNDTITVFFSNGTMYLGIEGVEYDFVPSLEQPLTYEDDKKRIERDAQIIKDIIEIVVQPIM